MKKDIHIPEVKNVHVAAVKESHPDKTVGWNVYIVNNKNEMIDGVMVSSKGYSDHPNGAQIKTSVMRHVIGNVPAKTAAKIEPISEEVFGINNEFWVTFFEGNKLMEKKFIFGAHTISEALQEDVPVMNVKGVVVW
tara:strand:+ start:25764 stop:26171 length:408 start_codon:yes stop_codon:yes gene_type:complete